MKPTGKQVDDVVARLQGTSDSIEQAMYALDIEGIDVDDMGDAVEWYIERCKGCDWWHEVGELSNPDGEDGYCSDCNPRES